MNQINRLGLRVACITAVIIIILVGLFWGIGKVYSSLFSSEENPASGVAQATPSAPPVDFRGYVANNSGSNNAVPRSTATSLPVVKDSEVEVSPLPTGLLTGSKVIDKNTFTGKYLASLPDNISQAEAMDTQRMQAWVKDNAGDLLPALPSGTVKATGTDSKATIQKYLDSVSPAQNPALASVSSDEINQAFTDRVSKPEELQSILAKLQQNLKTLKGVAVPPAAVELQTKQLQFVQALIDNVQLMINAGQDPIGSLVAAKKIDDLALAASDIASQIEALRKKFKIT